MTINLATRTLERDGQSMSLTTENSPCQGPGHEPEDASVARQADGARAGREYECSDRSIDVQVRACASSSRWIPRIPPISRPFGVRLVFVPDARRNESDGLVPRRSCGDLYPARSAGPGDHGRLSGSSAPMSSTRARQISQNFSASSI